MTLDTPDRGLRASLSSFLHTLRRPRVGAYGALVLGVAVVAMIWAGAFYAVHEERRAVETDARQTTKNLARAFEEQIIRAIRGVDQTLLFVRDIYARDPRGFDVLPWAAASERANDFAFQVSIIDRDGRFLTSNLDPSGGARVDLSDREHFRVQKEGVGDELFISRPILGRVSKKWSINISRRISAPDGSFLGAAVVSVDPADLTRFYDQIDLGQGGAITLVGTDGVVRARVADGVGMNEVAVAELPLTERFAETPDGTLDFRSKFDGVDRIVSFRKVRGLPLVVAVGLSDRTVLAPYERTRRVWLVGAAVLTLGVIAVLVMIQRYQAGLRRTTAAAEAVARARSEFLAVISHEIRTPLNGVIGMADLLVGSRLEGEPKRFARTLRDAAEHLLHVVSDVLDFSKLDSGSLDVEDLSFDLVELVETTVQALAPRAQDKGLALAAVFSPDLPRTVTGDPGRIRQVLLNLLTNGVKFTETGGVTIDVTRTASREAGRVGIAFEIADSGIGIAEEAMARLFRAFEQADISVWRQFGGTGLGLAISKRLVDRMGGTIAVTSAVGRGTTFRVALELPIAGEAIETIGGVATSRPRVLVVDRNPVSRAAMVRQLAALGAEASAANTPALGISMAWDAAVTAHPFACVVVDESITTVDIAGSLRAEPCMATTRLVLTTASLGNDPDGVIRSRFDVVLGKPVSFAAVCRRILDDVALPEPAARTEPDRPVLGVAHPLRILVAEDNPINQLVASKLLESLGYRADLVPDGATALTAVRTVPYDLVFMDVTMPEMDGLTATRAIRALPDPARRVHIVALTANAFKHDAETCRAAGMNDFVGKPVTRERLEAAIRRYFGLRVQRERIGTAVGVPMVFDRAVFDRLGDAIGADGARQVLDTFMSDTAKRVRLLRSRAAARKAGEVEHEAHTLKSAAGSLGFTRLAEIARQLEADARAGRVQDLDRLGVALSVAFEELSGTVDELGKVA